MRSTPLVSLLLAIFFMASFSHAIDAEPFIDFTYTPIGTEFGPHRTYPGDLPGQQNEPLQIAKTLRGMKQGTVITMGGEQAFLLASLYRGTTGLFIVEPRPNVAIYTLAVMGLVLLSEGSQEYRYLRLRASHQEWRERSKKLDDRYSEIKKILEDENFFNWWSKTARPQEFENADGFSHLFQARFPGRSSNIYAPVASYVYQDDHFYWLKAVLSGTSVFHTLAQPEGEEPPVGLGRQQVLQKIVALHRQDEQEIAIIDFGHLAQYGYGVAQDPAFSAADIQGVLEGLSSVTKKEAKVLLTLAQSPSIYAATLGALKGLFPHDYYGIPVATLRSKKKRLEEALSLVTQSANASLYGAATVEAPSAEKFKSIFGDSCAAHLD